MHRTTRSARRVLLAPVLLFCLMLAGSAPAAAAYSTPFEHKTGQTGSWDFRDYPYSGHNGSVDCDYRKLADDNRKIKHFQIRTPRIWWMNTNSDVDNQHGTVGWRFRLQENTHPETHPNDWTTVFKSGIQKRTAYEGAYDDSFKANFSARSLDWSSSRNVVYRIKSTVTWYKSNGEIKGSVDHWYDLYDANNGVLPTTGYCQNKVSL